MINILVFITKTQHYQPINKSDFVMYCSKLYFYVTAICNLETKQSDSLSTLSVVYAASIVHSPKLPSHDFGKIERGLPHSCHTILHAKPHLHHNGDQIVIISSAVQKGA